MSFTVFYSWQADLPSRSNRTYVEKALAHALRIFEGGSLEEAPRLDRDTKNVSGTPRITESIFQKIEECGIFAADVSFVSATEGKKKVPNPNVLVELGYAAKAVGWDRILLVMNTHFGPPEELPFDLRERRFPICYSQDPAAQANKEERKGLEKNLYFAINSVIEAGLKPYLRYGYRFFERSRNPFAPDLSDLTAEDGKAFLKMIEFAKSKVEHNWIRERPRHEFDRFRRVNDYVFRVFREMWFIQEKWFSVYDRYFQGLRTMPTIPSYTSDAPVQIEFAPTDQLDHWRDIGYADSLAPVQLRCDQYRASSGDGYTVTALLKIGTRVWQNSMHIGPEECPSKSNFLWVALPETNDTI